jgi:lipopolysaccharide transport system permease protein
LRDPAPGKRGHPRRRGLLSGRASRPGLLAIAHSGAIFRYSSRVTLKAESVAQWQYFSRVVRVFHRPIAAVWPSRWLLLNFVARDIKSRYVGSASGLGWTLMQPLALLAIYGFVFTAIFQLKFPELGNVGFVAFLAIALWPWQMFQDGVQRSIMAIQSNAGLIRKVAFPRELLVYAAVIAAFVVHLIGYVVVLVALRLTGESLQIAGIFLALLMVVALFLACVGLGLILSAVQVVVRDVEHIVGPLFMVLFYATPILYPLNMVPERYRGLLLWNPLTLVMSRLRDGLLGGALPEWSDVLIIVLAALFVVGANAFFHRVAPHFEDFL